VCSSESFDHREYGVDGLGEIERGRVDDLDAVARLKRNGNMTTRQLAVRLEEACRAAS